MTILDFTVYKEIKAGLDCFGGEAEVLSEAPGPIVVRGVPDKDIRRWGWEQSGDLWTYDLYRQDVLPDLEALSEILTER